ncbi:unnamed protein product [Ceutorhynchus assimilis]|uniref:TMC domain-containing protein n=1 Tax=Ceutorhynchus assimilis TaxID=467358 RepID=A0A9P0GPE9_9CUCU|nr:unnamed protein product [Ceutorhynchus assimilis]
MQQLQHQQSLQCLQDRAQIPEETIETNESDEDDYSASVNVIIQRRASTRRSKKQSRRASSPFLPGEAPACSVAQERRRSSVFTTSSGDTAITVDDNAANEVTQDEIFENIKLHKEVLSNVKMQPWSMRKKLKLVLQAKSYIKKHEGQLQERLAQSHSTKDMLARWNILLIKKWQKWKRELTNMSMWFIPWELKIKEIESHFGSVVASYFIFLRWLFWVNIVIAIAIISFVTIPEIITADPEAVKERKFVLKEEQYNSTNFLTLWDFEGVFKYSPLFYGWYTNRDYNDSTVFNGFEGKKVHGNGYRLPFAYFVTGLVVYAYSFFATLRKMAENSRMSKLSEKDDECIFSWKLFTAWDYMIGNSETAHNRVASIVMGFKEALLEEAEKKRESRNWKVICFRVLVNSLVVGLLTCSAYAVVIVVKRSTEPDANSNIWRRNEITVVMSLITVIFPMFFEVLGFVEQYHPRKQLRLQLARIMVLNLLNLYSLIFALFDKITDMTILLQEIKYNLSKPQTTDVAFYTSPNPYEALQSYDDNSISAFHCICSDNLILDQTGISMDLISNLAENLSTLAMPTLNNLLTTLHDFTDLNNATESTWINSTIEYENSTNYLNFTITAEELKDLFVDYLTYILSPFVVLNNTDIINITLTPTDNYEHFKTTLLPLFNDTTPQEEQRFETELTTLFEEITSTITSSYTDIFTSTTTETSETITIDNTDLKCQTYCDTFTTAIKTTVNYGEAEYRKTLNYTMNAKLRSLCWETMFGQELIKLTVMDLILTGFTTLMMDFFRGIFVRVMNRCWCWDLEKNFPQYGDFKVAENILHLVNNQGMVWMGMFFSPGLVVLNVIKLYLMMYLRAWAVLTCNVPHEIIFRASRSNNFYYALLLMMLFLCVLPVGYAVVWIEPSWHCGPFSGYQKIFHIFTKTIRANTPNSMHRALDYIASPGIVIPLLLLLVLIIYYLISLTGALREANVDLKTQLRRERTEERRKLFQLADRRRRGGSGESADQTPFSKWKKLLGNLPSTKSCEDTRQESEDIAPSQRADEEEEEDEKVENKGKVFFTKLIKQVLGKSSTSSDEQDGTDTDQHEPLPYDNTKEHKSGDSTELAIKSIVSKWSLRRNSNRDKKNEDLSNEAIELEDYKIKKHTKKSKNQEESTTEATKYHKRGKEENVFLQKVIEAKKAGVFEDIKVIEEQPRKSHKRMKTKPKKPIIELDEDAFEPSPPLTRKDQRQDSTDAIPVITISKTYSDENVESKNLENYKQPVNKSEVKRKFVFKDKDFASSSSSSDEEKITFRPKVKCVLRKQATAIDEDVIIHFGSDLEKADKEKQMYLDAIKDFDESSTPLKLETGDTSDKSTSEDTEMKDDNSVDTILKAPFHLQMEKTDCRVDENDDLRLDNSSRSNTE